MLNQIREELLPPRWQKCLGKAVQKDMLIVTVIVIENSPMNPALPPLQTAKPADRSQTGAV